jgi:hypothetical protein
MILRIIILNAFLFGTMLAHSQQWAGPDKEACGDLGVMIGSSDPCEGCCYLWTPNTNLSCTDCKNPMANPLTTTEYSVVVTDHNLRKIGSDVVKVTTVFTEMLFTPDHLVQDDSEAKVTASILDKGNVDLPAEISWNIVPPFLGCMIEQNGLNAEITPGPQFGKVIIKASNLNVPGCFVEEELPINKGVKDVLAVDLTAPSERIAKNGETLYVLDDAAVHIEAIPNEGGYPEGLPDWQQDSYNSQTPPDEDWSVDMFEMLPENFIESRTSQYIAGELPEGNPKVTVVRKKQALLEETPINLLGIDTLDKLVKKYFKFLDEPEFPCGSPAPFNIAIDIVGAKIKASEVEGYNSPLLGTKKEVTFAAGLTASGRIYHPALTKTLAIKVFGGEDVVLCTRLFAELLGTLEVNLPFIQSDSLQDNTWNVSDPSLTAGFGISVNLEVAFYPPGYMFDASAKASSKFEITFTYVRSLQQIQYKVKITPATATIKLNIKYESNPGKYEDLLPKALTKYLSNTIEIFKAKEYGPWELHQF